MHFRFAEIAMRRACQQRQRGVGQLRRQGHAPALPGRYQTAAGARPFHIGRHVLHSHQFELSPGKRKHLAFAQPRDKRFLYGADPATADELDVHAGARRDGAHIHAMAPRQIVARHAVDALGVGGNALVIGVGSQ